MFKITVEVTDPDHKIKTITVTTRDDLSDLTNNSKRKRPYQKDYYQANKDKINARRREMTKLRNQMMSL